MLQSNQINNENSLPPIKSIPYNAQGKVKVLSFDVNFSTKETEAEEDILLVKLPRLNAKIIQIGLTSAETTIKDENGITVDGTFSLVNSNITYSSVNGVYNIIKDTEIKTKIPFNSIGSSVFNVNVTVSVPTAVNSDNYIKIKSSIPFTKANILNGYILYIAD